MKYNNHYIFAEINDGYYIVEDPDTIHGYSIKSSFVDHEGELRLVYFEDSEKGHDQMRELIDRLVGKGMIEAHDFIYIHTCTIYIESHDVSTYR